MTAKLLTGKPIADKIIPALSSRVESLALKGIRPCLAVVRVGERPDDVAYENSISRQADALGIVLRRETLSADADTACITDAIRSLSAAASVADAATTTTSSSTSSTAGASDVDADASAVHGILVFRPLPAQTDETAVLSAIPRTKDVDGVTASQMAGLYSMKTYEGAASTLFCPCTAEAVIRVLDHYGIPIGGKRAVVVGRSTVIGKPVAHLLLARDADVTICHSKTRDIAELTREADIVVCAAGLASGGRANRLDAKYFAPGQTIIDVAVNADSDGVYGDVDTDAVAGVVENITPVPGGLGAVTTLVVMEHVIRAAGGRA
jgi:methylenetetrahydrofolate dehydrogenase (NADP+)/methenyltetrahydrofolate cyclohydrolase